VGGAIGSFAGSLALNAAAGDKMKDFERRDKGIPMDDPEQRGYLNRLVQQERYYRSGADPNTGLANRLVQQSGAQAQANLARAGGPGTVQNLLSSQNVTNRGLAANAAQAAGMADNMLGMQGNLINMMASRRYDRQRYRRDLSLMQGQQQQQNANNMFSSAAETEVLKLEGEYAKLLTDGETEKAVAVMSKIRKIERDMTDAKADMKTQAAVSLAVENTRYGVALERIEAAFPKLNPDHDDYDEDLMTDVADLKVTYQRRGMTPTDALQKAVKKLVGTETTKQEAATEVKPQVTTKDVAAERKKAAVEKALDGAKKTPPSTKDVGMDSDKAGGTISAKDVLKMSYKDFSALPEETLARMRGDML
jgi:hypothetical protein